MQIRDVMTQAVKTCRAETNLAEAATLMWENDCGVLPVVNEENQVIGLLTDRDICMAVVTQNQLASKLNAGQVISGKVYGCAEEEEIGNAIKVMKDMQVRRIPVIAKNGTLQGILSLSDLALKADPKPDQGNGDFSYEDVLKVLKAVSETHKQVEQAEHP